MRISLGSSSLPEELIFTTSLSSAKARKIQRQAEAGILLRICKGVYAPKLSADELAVLIRRSWQQIAGVIVSGGVVSHISAMKGGVLESGDLILSHPTAYNRKILLPGLRIRVVRGPGPLPWDLPIGISGIQYAGRARLLMENLGRKSDLRASREDVENLLVSVLNASGEKALNEIRDQAAASAPALGAENALQELRGIIGALLGTHAKGVKQRPTLSTYQRPNFSTFSVWFVCFLRCLKRNESFPVSRMSQ